MKNLTTGLLILTVMMFIGLGCSNLESKTTDDTTNRSANNSSNSNKSGISTSSSPSADPQKTFGDDLEGSYAITGKNPDGRAYQGDLTIKKQDQVYQFSWKAGSAVYDGVGVRDGNLVAAGYGAGTDGKGCGAALYKIGDKTLDGKLGGWGFNQVGTQSAFLIKQNKDGGLFTVSGTDTDGSDYKGELYIAESKSDVYHFAFSGGKIKYIGTGIKVGDYFGAGLGVKQCGYVVYDIKSDRLEAAWGTVGDDKLGTEIATRK